MAEAKSEGAIQLPILERLTVGNPLRATGYSGFLFSVTEHAAYLTKQARDPYLLRFMGEDHTGRFVKGDLLLVDQDDADHGGTVRIVEYKGQLCLTRTAGSMYEIFFPEAVRVCRDERLPVAGWVKAIVWAVV